MFDQLSFEGFTELAKQGNNIAVYQEIVGDQLTPISAYLALNDSSQQISLLESNPKEINLGRFSHLCFGVIASIEITDKEVTYCSHNKKTCQTAEPLSALRKFQRDHQAINPHPQATIIGGMVGFLSFDAIRWQEHLPSRHRNTCEVPDALFRSYANSITFDHKTNKVIIMTLAQLNADLSLQQSYHRAMKKIDAIRQRLFSNTLSPAHATVHKPTKVEAEINNEEYTRLVKKAQQYIAAGDIFQVVLSRGFKQQLNVAPFAVYRAIRFTNPSPYLFYLEADNFSIAGASPEKLVSVQNRQMESCPLAGTRVRGKTRAHDEALANELRNSDKEVAEHMMLVDLARNDLGRLAKPGSVKVVELKAIEHYARVMHLSSTVQAELDSPYDVFDALIHSLPAGTLSGAPKIRAIQIIDELESSRRGIYGGSVCLIDCNANLASCIAIRMAFMQNNHVTVRSGAGVVFDSDPAMEAQETQDKAQAILEGIALAARGGL